MGINLKSILNKKSGMFSLLDNLLQHVNTRLLITDTTDTVLFSNDPSVTDQHFPIEADGEIAGFVKGDEKAGSIAAILNMVLQKEGDKKKLGKEVLNLYKEINVIFNFSEKLAQTIDPVSIARVALSEVAQSIPSNGGVVILWDEPSKQLQAVATSGDIFFNAEKINTGMGLLLKIVLSGLSEITSDISALKESGIINDKVHSLIYGALKVNQRVMGAIILANYEGSQYAAADLKLLTTLSLQSSSAIESAMLYEKNIREARDKEEAMRRIYEVTGRFVPFEFIKSLGHDRITEVKLGDHVEKIVTVLFSDIREYTALSEKMTPQENFGFVRSFNEMMGPVIRNHHGFINQYLGDAIMAIFPGNAMDALKAAVEMQLKMQEFNSARQAKNLPVVQIGIGMHTGPLVMGIIGDADRLDAATISDTVNTASRLESLTKYYKAGIIISENALQQISEENTFHLRYLGKVQLKGKLSATGIHECFSGTRPQDIQYRLNTLPVFNEAMGHYINKSFEEASQAFLKIAEINPDDLTVKLFLNNATRYLQLGVPETWSGVEEMVSK